MTSYESDYFYTHVPEIHENELLRTPQKIAYSRVFEHFIIKRSSTHAIVVLPTGVGKTGLMGLLPYGISNGRVLIITPQLVIKDHITDSLDPDYPGNFWLKHKVFKNMSDLPVLIEYDSKTSDEVLSLSNIVVVNIQKLQARLTMSLINRVSRDFFDMVIIDEAHHSTADSWIDVLRHFSRAKVVKLTGTPFRSDGKPILGEMIYEYKLGAAMANGYVKSLENFEYVPDKLLFTLDNDDDKEYTLDEILSMNLKDSDWISRTVAFSKDCSRSVVKKSVELLQNRIEYSNSLPLKILAVACSIPHAEQIKELYEQEGLSTTIVHSELLKEEKDKALSDIENNRVSAVVNVAMLGEGYDHKYLSVGAIFRPFRHQLPYEQFVGRLLRIIPSEEKPNTTDNIAIIVAHKELNLGDLWNLYKEEMREADIIKQLEDLDLISDIPNNDDQTNREYNSDVGKAIEYGEGKLQVDSYITTELIKRRQKEEAEELAKIEGLQQLLNISAEEAKKLILQTKAKSLLRRPDVFVQLKKHAIDDRIKQNIVPKLLVDYGIEKTKRNLKDSRLFKDRKYSWISNNKKKNNAAMLAIYISNALNKLIGAKRDDWTISDWEIADQKLDEVEEYVTKVLEDFSATTRKG